MKNIFEEIANNSSNVDELSRNVIAYFSEEKFDEALADDDSPECRLFNLAMRYLDKSHAIERETIEREFEKLVAEYKNSS